LEQTNAKFYISEAIIVVITGITRRMCKA